MSGSVLFDAAGPRTRARHRLYGVLGSVVVLAAVGYALWRLADDGQFDYEKWEVFFTPTYIEVLIIDGLLETLQMAFTAILGAVVFGTIFGIGKLSDHRWVSWPCWVVVEFFRAIPVLLLMVFSFYMIGVNNDSAPFLGVVIALTLYNGSVLAEVLRAGVLAVPKGQAEAAYAIGMRKSQVMNIVQLPQAVKIMLPAIISQCVVALKDTALGAWILAPGLTFVSRQIYKGFHNQIPTMIVVAALYILLNIILTIIATWAQKKFVGEKKILEVPPAGAVPVPQPKP